MKKLIETSFPKKKKEKNKEDLMDSIESIIYSLLRYFGYTKN